MVSKKAKQKIVKHRICAVARVVACASFLGLVIIGISSVVRAMSLETIANENGIPSVWQAASLSEPDSITLPITYWDQKADACDDENRQFEWTECDRYRTHGVVMGIVKPRLGADRLPIPAFSDVEASWATLHDALSINVIGHDPVQKTDNFYRWFHEVPGLSRRINGRTVTFNRTTKGVYVYGGQDVYPIDDVAGLDATDVKLNDWQGRLHNFNFTAHLGFSIKVNATGNELFQFSGDDDVWVFLNNRLVLDIGGLHGPISGWFKINPDGTVSTHVEKVNDLSIRADDWAECMRIRDGVYADESCIGPYNTKIRENFKDVATYNVDFGLKPDDVVNLDFFYAERSTDGSNTKITINHMNWPISADSHLDAEVVGRIGETDSNLIKFTSSITNRDLENPLNIERIAAYIDEVTDAGEQSSGFLPLSSKTLYYSSTPADETSWQPVELSAPDNSMNGFKLATPLQLAPNGEVGDTLYFRYFGESADLDGSMSGVISYYTSLSGVAGVTYDADKVSYKAPTEYKVTVKYLYETDESEAAPTYTEVLPTGGEYTVVSPEIDGYTPDINKISGVIKDSDVEYVVYYRQVPEVPPAPEEPKQKYKVTVKYIYEDGTPAAESYVEELESGDEYSVISPEIENYAPDQPKVEGVIVDQDIEHIVVYRAVVTPEPDEPVEDDEPKIPMPPAIPPSDIIDGELVYLAPLGEVAYVPNTGIIRDAVAAVFEDAFAEIILSQGCVMMMLLIFAGSFSTYFSLRKFAHLDVVTATRSANAGKRKTYAKMGKKTMPKSKPSVRAVKSAKVTKSARKAKK